MNLKESYQYQNHITSLFAQTYASLGSNAYVTRTERTHCRSKAAEGAIDETVDENMERPFGNVPVDAVIDFACALIAERTDLGAAITDAKYRAKIVSFSGDDIDLDAELSANKFRHQLIARLENMADIKPEVIRKSTAKDYKFNAEGNQAPYFYPVEDKIVIDFNRDDLCAKRKKIKEVASAMSMRAEKAMLDTNVEFAPKFDIHDSYLDTLTKFAIEANYMKPDCK